jgi:hypothetical protein
MGRGAILTAASSCDSSHTSRCGSEPRP